MELTAYKNFMSEVLLLCKVMFWDMIKNGNILPEALIFIQLIANFFSTIWNQYSDNDAKPRTTQPAADQTSTQGSMVPIQNSENRDRSNDDDHHLSIGEIKMVMEKLGLEYSDQAKGTDDHDHDESIVGTNQIPSLFDQEEPSLDEIKDAFDVFDVNKDGFIDVVELHRVLCNLGQKERAGLDECKKMINGFDQNGDGLIDFGEFVRLMEKSFC